jgi:hypothetical protein
MQTINATVTSTAATPVDKISGAGLPNSRKYLVIHNPSLTANLGFTFDGTAPVIGTNGFTLLAGGTFTSDQYDMNGGVKIISSIASSSATLMWG